MDEVLLVEYPEQYPGLGINLTLTAGTTTWRRYNRANAHTIAYLYILSVRVILCTAMQSSDSSQLWIRLKIYFPE